MPKPRSFQCRWCDCGFYVIFILLAKLTLREFIASVFNSVVTVYIWSKQVHRRVWLSAWLLMIEISSLAEQFLTICSKMFFLFYNYCSFKFISGSKWMLCSSYRLLFLHVFYFPMFKDSLQKLCESYKFTIWEFLVSIIQFANLVDI